MDYRSIIIGSPPRTGGMWTYNVVREIFIQLNKKIIPTDIPQDDNIMFIDPAVKLKELIRFEIKDFE